MRGHSFSSLAGKRSISCLWCSSATQDVSLQDSSQQGAGGQAEGGATMLITSTSSAVGSVYTEPSTGVHHHPVQARSKAAQIPVVEEGGTSAHPGSSTDRGASQPHLGWQARAGMLLGKIRCSLGSGVNLVKAGMIVAAAGFLFFRRR